MTDQRDAFGRNAPRYPIEDKLKYVDRKIDALSKAILALIVAWVGIFVLIIALLVKGY